MKRRYERCDASAMNVLCGRNVISTTITIAPKGLLKDSAVPPLNGVLQILLTREEGIVRGIVNKSASGMFVRLFRARPWETLM